MQTINITVPRGWHELTQRQLRYLIFERYSSTAIKTLCLFRWFSRKYYASVMNIKEFFADNLGNEFIGIIADAFLKQ
jgi:hypothetical protein